ncbi:MAG: immunoglobulin domain-containing protein [Verrucomicrobiales bacterium]|nr:immunoglobulin domain-containing protein [Verrucomicrobiales bacterium]
MAEAQLSGSLPARWVQLQARIAAEPHRVKEILHEAGTDWCGAAAQTRVRNPLRLMAAGACQTEGPADLPANRDACIPNANTPFKTIRLKFNVFRNNDGSDAAATQAQVDAQLAELNAAYAPAKIRFVQTTEFINDSRYRSLSYYVNSEEADLKAQHADRPDQQHNIYVVDIEPDPNSGGSLLGVSTFPWDPDTTRAGGGTILDDGSIGAGQKTLVHELGHALGLWHTHHGVREVDECSACWERADGANANATGDFCSDTPPTPVNYKCQGPGGTDPCSGRAWGATAPQNYMGYAPDDCYTQFTPQQAGRMHCWINDKLTGWLTTDQQNSVSVAATDANASETGPDSGTFTVTRTGASTLALTVSLNLAGTATQGADFNNVGNSVVIPAGSASAVVRVTPVNDTAFEPTETVILTVAAGAGYQVGNPASATVSIQDNDTPTGPIVTVAATDANASEQGGDPGVFTISRTGATTAALTVGYTVAGTATSPADYSPALSGTLVIPAGAASATLNIVPQDDAAVEPAETVEIRLANGAGYNVGEPGTATVTIADNDAPVSNVLLAESFDAVTAPVLPNGWAFQVGGIGLQWQTFKFDGPTPPNIVYVSSVDGVGDSALVSPVIQVPAAGAKVTFVHGFGLEEGFDGAVLEISVGGGQFNDILAAGGSFVENGYNGQISATDGSPIAGRRAWTGTTGDNISTTAQFPATAAGKAVQLRWRLSSDGGVAEAGWGLDNIEVTSGSGGGGNTITVSVVATDGEAGEAGTNPGVFTLTRSGNTAAGLVVNVTLAGTATVGADFAAIPGTVSFAAGSGTATVTISPVNDTTPEALETVVLTVGPGAGYSAGAPDAATVTLLDDDGGGGGSNVVFSENFDGVTAPSLPSGWSANLEGAGFPWRTALFDGLTPPNVAVAPGPEAESNNTLTSPQITIASAEARLTFEHGFLLEDGYDGGVLEISVDGGAFVDWLAAGGAFVANGYNGVISSVDGSLIAGRSAWTGETVGNVKTEARFPAGAIGKSVRLRWRLVTDGGVASDGWGIDNVTVTDAASTGGLPLVSVTVSDESAAEYGSDAGEITLSRTGSTAAPLTVGFTVGGTATEGADFQAMGTTATIPAGSSTMSLKIVPSNDTSNEGAETVEISLRADPSYSLGGSRSGRITVLDNGSGAGVVFAASMDEVSTPALPDGWTVNLVGVGAPWETAGGSASTAPNRLFAADQDGVADNTVTSPLIPIATATAQLTFIHDYQLEPGYDGGVLEIAIGAAGAFQDILAAGGTFVAGGYDGPLSANDGSPIPGRNAWTGQSGGPKATRVNLPAAAAGQSIRLRWRCASDSGVSDRGWFVDTIAVTEGAAAGGADLAVSIAANPAPVVAESKLTYTITVTNQTASVARGVVLSNALPANVRMISATASQGTVSGTNTLVAQLGLLNSRGSASLSVVVVANTPGTLNTAANVGAADADPNLANNAANSSVTVLPTSTPSFGFTNAAPINLTEAAGPATVFPSTINVAGFNGTVGRIAVNLHGVSHTFPDDLDIVLVGPGGQKVVLMSDAGGDQRFAITHAALTFEEDAPNPLPDRAEITSGTYRPTDFEPGDVLPAGAPSGPYGTSLGVFTGTNPNGNWQLFVADDEAKDSGRIAAGWSLTITRAVANVTPPSITAQPQSQVVAGGATVSFSVVATGSAPLSYQWRFNGADLSGATGSTLTFNKVTPDQAGEYSVKVSNDGGVVVSRSANLAVTTQARRVTLGQANGAVGTVVDVPVTLAAIGDENRVRFSVGFDAEQLGFVSATTGPGAAGAALTLNVNQLESGRVGVQVSLPANQAFTAGQRQIALLSFTILPSATGAIDLGFRDAPVAREASAVNGTSLPADFLPGTITVAAGPSGPSLGALTVSDAGRVQFAVTGQAGASFRIEASTDLRAWSAVTVLANPTGTVVFNDPNPVGGGPRFYRAVQQ